MVQVIEAIYDGAVFRPTVPVTAETEHWRARSRSTETLGQAHRMNSYLETASSLKLDGPADWAANIEDYLYRRPDEHAA